MTAELWNREAFVEKLRAIGVRGYHDKHPFHVAMNEGRLSPKRCAAGSRIGSIISETFRSKTPRSSATASARSATGLDSSDSRPRRRFFGRC